MGRGLAPTIIPRAADVPWCVAGCAVAGCWLLVAGCWLLVAAAARGRTRVALVCVCVLSARVATVGRRPLGTLRGVHTCVYKRLHRSRSPGENAERNCNCRANTVRYSQATDVRVTASRGVKK